MIVYLITTSAPAPRAHKNSLPSTSTSFSFSSLIFFFLNTDTPVFIADYTRLLSTINTFLIILGIIPSNSLKSTFAQHQAPKMRYSIIAAPVALAACVSAATINGTFVTSTSAAFATSYVTQVVSTLTTYCPSATTLSINGNVITVTQVSCSCFVLLQ